MKKAIIFFLVLCSASLACKSQKTNFSYKAYSKSLVPKSIDQVDNVNFFDATKALPAGYAKDGSVDYTLLIQKVLNENSYVKMPNFPILINDQGLSLKSNSVVFFQDKSKLIKSATSLGKYQLLNIHNVENVRVFSPRLIGDRKMHQGNKGEWGMGISILSSKNVSVFNSEINNFWGDGIYIGYSKSNQSENVLIKGGVIDNNRRNAISLISGRNITIENILLSNSNGTLPMAGIDIEPNNNLNILENIQLNNIITFNNGEYGISFVLLYMLGEKEKNVTIDVDGHTDYYSKSAFYMGGNKLKYPKQIRPFSGNIKVRNVNWHDSVKDLLMASDFSYLPKYEFSNMKIYKKGKLNTGASTLNINSMKKRGISVTQ